MKQHAPLPILTELPKGCELQPGGHNWPDMEIVIDPRQTEIVADEVYLVQPRHRGEPVVKRCRDDGSCIRLDPALASVHDVDPVGLTLFGKKLPVIGMEFSDSIYKHAVHIHGRVVGLWAGEGAV